MATSHKRAPDKSLFSYVILVFFFIIPVCKHVLRGVMQSQIW